jgi:RHS repeat-associated protein
MQGTVPASSFSCSARRQERRLESSVCARPGRQSRRAFRKTCFSKKRAHLSANAPLVANSRTTHLGPFGEVIRATGPMAKVNPFTFQTEYYDWETDKIYWKNRYYDWSPGRWLSRDPVNEPGFNLLANGNSGKFKQDTDEEQEFDSDDSGDVVTPDTGTDQVSDLLYVFVQNNPENLIDDLGLTVYLQAHHVPLGLGFNHSKVTMVVGCGSRWLGQYPFVNPMPGQPGEYYGTIGAGPVHHKLTKGLNRKWDIRLQRNVFSTTISPPGGLSDDDFIGKLLDANAQYKDDLPYVLFPTRKGKGYNSNGYASGILLYVTGSMPPRPPHTPGFNKPVPGSEF